MFVVFQMAVTILTLGVLRFLGYVQFPALDRSIPRKVSVATFGNTCGRRYRISRQNSVPAVCTRCSSQHWRK